MYVPLTPVHRRDGLTVQCLNHVPACAQASSALANNETIPLACLVLAPLAFIYFSYALKVQPVLALQVPDVNTRTHTYTFSPGHMSKRLLQRRSWPSFASPWPVGYVSLMQQLRCRPTCLRNLGPAMQPPIAAHG
jgi:hypothetical protein